MLEYKKLPKKVCSDLSKVFGCLQSLSVQQIEAEALRLLLKDKKNGEFNILLQRDLSKLLNIQDLPILCFSTSFHQGHFLAKFTAKSAWCTVCDC